MSLDVYLKDPTATYKTDDLFWANITHNLGEMAAEAGIYEACWHPERINAKFAKDIIPLLEKGLRKLKESPEYFKKFNSPNGWGMYKHFVPWVEEYLAACKEYPNAIVETSV